jgi:hypothetical protein
MNDGSAPDASESRISERDVEFLDQVLQDLFGVGLKLEYCLSVLEDSPEQAKMGIEDAVSGLDEIASPIREQIQRLLKSLNLSSEVYC